MVIMAKDNQRKTKAVQLRLHPIIHQQLEVLKKRNLSTITREITDAILERLRENGLWPPNQPSKANP